MESKNKPIFREILSWLLWLGGAVLLALVIRTYIFTLVVVDGNSMETTLHNGEVMAVSILHYGVGTPKRGDVVVCNYPGSTEHYVKRVIGLPGEQIEVRDQVVYINGSPVNEPYLYEPPYENTPSQVIPQGYYFVMGDNRNHSSDSRMVGPIEESEIIGRTLAVLWPPQSMRGLPNDISITAKE